MRKFILNLIKYLAFYNDISFIRLWAKKRYCIFILECESCIIGAMSQNLGYLINKRPFEK
jgi:hypothetical protein